MQVYSLTGVPPERQKIMGFKGGLLKDDADMTAVGAKDGLSLMLVGTADEIRDLPAGKAAAFIEDTPGQLISSDLPVGIQNLGNTCYLNATIQALHSVAPLGRALTAYTGKEGDRARTFMRGLADVMRRLDGSTTIPLPSLMSFLAMFRSLFPQFAQQNNRGDYSQQDADECYTQLLATMAQQLTLPASGSAGSGSNNVVDSLFSIDLEASFRCTESEEPVVVRKESVRKLSCHITQQINHMQDGLKAALEESITKRSETLGRDAVYTKTSKISTLPPYLGISFVRFFWKAEERVKAKILRAVSFPFTLDMHGFCTPELQQSLDVSRKQVRERAESRKRKAADGAPGEGEPAAIFGETGIYELCAVVTHQGRTAESGHYIAWVREDDDTDSWLKFDDDKVSRVAADDVKKLAGGGDWHMAYLCLYRSQTAKSRF
eukprot:TRINITY_DN19265_c0_g1_i1.p1 TRINITY_DN19265_c0_g1~~TRINITY_DN19265_c0_g1_i1.p1  ORF type:complete len:468 (+),score=99.53 TRINITY_DN19265_c0_g1_i1:103-1404(+)